MTGMFSATASLVFLLAFGIIAAALIQGLRQWNRNNHSPLRTVDARVISKRMDIYRHSRPHAAGARGRSASSTTYHVTFQTDSGSRMELTVGGADYGQLAEGDRGKLSFQGTRYLGFDRFT